MPSPAIASVWDIDLLEVTEQNGEACLKIAQPIMYAKLLLATVETALTFEETFSYTVVWQADLPALE